MPRKKTTDYDNTSITTLKGADRVRKRPAVIFGSDGIDGCQHSVFEILSNSIDEAREGYGKKIEITRLILERFGQVDAIAGVATGAIPQGALVADALNLPFVYVRSTPKDHGLENLIEGELRPGMKVVVVEDLISTGGSSLKAVEAIRRDGCEVIGMVAAYTYGFPVAGKAFKDAKVPLVTLTNYEAVLDVALRTGYIEEDDIATLNEWRKDPAHWDAGK